jgi:hypothetical protein
MVPAVVAAAELLVTAAAAAFLMRVVAQSKQQCSQVYLRRVMCGQRVWTI